VIDPPFWGWRSVLSRRIGTFTPQSSSFLFRARTTVLDFLGPFELCSPPSVDTLEFFLLGERRIEIRSFFFRTVLGVQLVFPPFFFFCIAF